MTTKTTKQEKSLSIKELIDHLATTDAKINPEHANQIMEMAYQVLRNMIEERKLNLRVVQ